MKNLFNTLKTSLNNAFTSVKAYFSKKTVTDIATDIFLAPMRLCAWSVTGLCEAAVEAVDDRAPLRAAFLFVGMYCAGSVTVVLTTVVYLALFGETLGALALCVAMLAVVFETADAAADEDVVEPLYAVS